LTESWTWLLQSKVLVGRGVLEKTPTALDVGCGPGLVMELLSPYLNVQGIDIDPDMVTASNARGQKAQVGRAEDLPFEDDSFDIVYSSFLLLWTPDPVRVVKEMARVSKDWVICLAEPDHVGRISYPPSVAEVDGHFVKGLKEQGADPEMGRKLQGIFSRCGLSPQMGVHSGLWSLGRMRTEAEEEWHSLASASGEVANERTLSKIKKGWDRAARDGSLVQYTPTFFALARKHGD
jgi:ubiquinone/menaquinone biosynthesis C-methylase UbiE